MRMRERRKEVDVIERILRVLDMRPTKGRWWWPTTIVTFFQQPVLEGDFE
jgi:hypothetical protein